MALRRNELGVAMVTVLLVGASLTVLATTAAVSTVRELRSNSADMKAAEALSYAEAGVDRFLQHIRSGLITWHHLIRAGCEDPEGLTVPVGSVGSGTYEATLKVFDPNPPSGNPADRYVPAACDTRISQPNDPNGPQHFIITSEGTESASHRVVQQIVKIGPLGLPIGIIAPSIDANGQPSLMGISMFTDGQLKGRDKLDFQGTDPYYYMKDVFPDGVSGRSMTEHVPSGAHALGGIFMKNNGTKPEFPGPDSSEPQKNCTADSGAQSLWDSDGSSASGPISSGCSGQVGYPLTSRFTSAIMDGIRPHTLTEQDHQILRQAAKSWGIYCAFGSTATCTRMGQPISPVATWNDVDIQPLYTAGINNFIAYFDYLSGSTLTNEVKWHASVGPCDTSDPDANKSAVIVVRRGSFMHNSGSTINGALLIDGEYRFNGNATVIGTIISQSGFWVRGGATFSMTECWVQNMPGPFLTSAPVSWSEIDR